MATQKNLKEAFAGESQAKVYGNAPDKCPICNCPGSKFSEIL